MQTLTETTEINISYTQIFWVSCDQPMPGPIPFPNSRKGPGIEVDGRRHNVVTTSVTHFFVLTTL